MNSFFNEDFLCSSSVYSCRFLISSASVRSISLVGSKPDFNELFIEKNGLSEVICEDRLLFKGTCL